MIRLAIMPALLVLAAIVFAHRMAKVEPPTSQPGAGDLGLVVGGIRRTKKDDEINKKRAADGDILRDMLRSITGDDLRAHRPQRRLEAPRRFGNVG